MKCVLIQVILTDVEDRDEAEELRDAMDRGWLTGMHDALRSKGKTMKDVSETGLTLFPATYTLEVP